MFGLIFFIVITIILINKLNDILGMHIGFKAETRSNIFRPNDNSVEEVIHDEKNKMDEKLSRISKEYRGFSKEDFLQKSQKVFELVFEAYANGDKGTLRDLLSKRIFNAFSMAIDDRKSKGEKLEGILVRFISLEIVDAEVTKEDLFITVKFVTEQSNVLKSKDGKVIEGNSDFVEKRVDTWVFERKKLSPDLRWFLHEIKDQS